MEGFWMIDLEGNLVDVNEAYCRMSGYSRQELLSMHTSDVEVNEPSPDLVVQHAQRITQSGSDRFETRHRCKDGRIIEVEVIATFLKLQEPCVFAFMRDITERKRAEQLLRASQERFRQLAENIREVFWITNPAKNEMIYISPGYEEIWGRTCESLYASPMSWVEAIHPDDRERVVGTALTKQISGQYDEVYRIMRPDGSPRWIHDRAFPICGDSGEVYRVVGIAKDITERKLAETHLATLVHAVESTGEMICITDIEDRFTFVNRAFLRGYGYTEVEILGKTPDILLAPNNPPTLMSEILEQTRFDGWRGEVLDRRKDGTEFPIFLSTSKIVDPDGRVSGLMGVAQDITERKRAEAALQQLAVIVENSEDAIISKTLDGVIVTWNRGAERIYGYMAQEIVGRSITMLLPPDGAEEMFEILGKIARGERVASYETVRQRKDGSMIEVSLTISPTKDANGKVTGASVITRDISERRKLEKELLEISAEERCRIGHDLHDGLGQHLTGIALKTKILEQALNGEDSPQIGNARQIVKLLNDAIGQTRTLARGLDPVHVEITGLPAALQSLATQSAELFRVHCAFRCGQEDLQIKPQTALTLYYIAQEAIRNAATHGLVQRIELELVVDSTRLSLTIRDDGRGFSNESRSAAGMGLHIMHYRARSIGGNLVVETAPNKGTEVRCVVPIKLCLTTQ
jgi:PAS domain S-box-containing protein